MKLKIIMSILVIAVLITGITGIKVIKNANAEKQKKEIIVATSAIRPPFIFIDNKTHKMVGYDYEITEAVAKKMGYTIKWEDMQFDGMIPSLIMGKVDVIASALSINDERKKKIDYSDSYNKVGSRVTVLSKNSSINSINDLKDKKVGVAIGTVQEIIAQENKELIGEIITFNGGDESFLALTGGKVDALIENGAQVGYYLSVKKMQNIKMVGDLLKPMEMAFGLRKGNDALLKEFNKALKQLKDDGTQARLYKKWFGE